MYIYAYISFMHFLFLLIERVQIDATFLVRLCDYYRLETRQSEIDRTAN